MIERAPAQRCCSPLAGENVVARARRLAATEAVDPIEFAEVMPQLLEVADRLAQIIDEAARALETGRPEGKVLAPVLREALAFLWPSGVK